MTFLRLASQSRERDCTVVNCHESPSGRWHARGQGFESPYLHRESVFGDRGVSDSVITSKNELDSRRPNR